MRKIRIYELAITYPEGAEERLEEIANDPYGDTPWIWRWPQERRFLSRSSAIARAERLAAMGCTVDVRQSEPIAWEDTPAAHFDAQEPTPPEAERLRPEDDPFSPDFELPWEQ